MMMKYCCSLKENQEIETPSWIECGPEAKGIQFQTEIIIRCKHCGYKQIKSIDLKKPINHDYLKKERDTREEVNKIFKPSSRREK